MKSLEEIESESAHMPLSKDADIEEIITQQGWTDETVLTLLWEYIDNQGDSRALRDFLYNRAFEENSAAESG